jgi:hypothetical protein
LLQKSQVLSMLAPIGCCSLLQAVVYSRMGFCGGGMGFVWVFFCMILTIRIDIIKNDFYMPKVPKVTKGGTKRLRQLSVHSFFGKRGDIKQR